MTVCLTCCGCADSAAVPGGADFQRVRRRAVGPLRQLRQRRLGLPAGLQLPRGLPVGWRPVRRATAVLVPAQWTAVRRRGEHQTGLQHLVRTHTAPHGTRLFSNLANFNMALSLLCIS